MDSIPLEINVWDFISPTWIAVGLAIYTYFAVMLMVIARKTGTPGGAMAWIPILNIYLMCRIAGKSGALVLPALVPFVNILVLGILWVGMARARGHSGAMGLLILVPVLGLVLPAILAAGDPSPGAAATTSTEPTAQRAPGTETYRVRPGTPCPRCGAAVEPGDTFCGDCGESLAAAPAPATAAASSSGGSVWAVVGMLVVLGGGWFAYSAFGGYQPPEREAPALPGGVAGTLSEFPIDPDPGITAQPTSVIAQDFPDTDSPRGSDVRVPERWLPPGVDPVLLRNNTVGIASTQYRPDPNFPPVNVHVIQPKAGRQTGTVITEEVARTTGGQRTGVRVESTTGRIYIGTRIETPQQLVYILINEVSGNVVVIFAVEPAAREVAHRLASAVGNGNGLLDYPHVRQTLVALPAAPPPDLALLGVDTFVRADFDRALAEIEGSSYGSSPEIRELTGQVRRFMPARLTTARYTDGQGQEWGMGVGEYSSARGSWITWTLLRGALAVGGGGAVELHGGTARYADLDDGRLLLYRRGPYIVVVSAPPSASIDRIGSLLHTVQI